MKLLKVEKKSLKYRERDLEMRTVIDDLERKMKNLEEQRKQSAVVDSSNSNNVTSNATSSVSQNRRMMSKSKSSADKALEFGTAKNKENENIRRANNYMHATSNNNNSNSNSNNNRKPIIKLQKRQLPLSMGYNLSDEDDGDNLEIGDFLPVPTINNAIKSKKAVAGNSFVSSQPRPRPSSGNTAVLSAKKQKREPKINSFFRAT